MNTEVAAPIDMSTVKSFLTFASSLEGAFMDDRYSLLEVVFCLTSGDVHYSVYDCYCNDQGVYVGIYDSDWDSAILQSDTREKE